MTVRRNAEHLLDLINDILDLSKIEAGTMDLFSQEINLCSLMGRLEKQMRPLSDAKNLRLEFAQVAESSVITADQTRLFQILVNIVSNAIKYTDEGKIKVAVSQEHDTDELVAMHQGRIEVNSEFGKGSEFSIVLPVNPLY